jgi:ATP-binding cassette subfamily F protein uup
LKEFRIDHLKKTYGDKDLFNDISFLIHEHDRIGLIGVNGTGKTSLLNIMAGIDGADGDVSPITAAKDYTIAYLSQMHDFNLEDTIIDAVFNGDSKILQTIRNYELALLALEVNGGDEDVQKRYAKHEELMTTEDAWNTEASAKSILSKLGINDLNKKVGELSGGQQKRVQMAQVLIESPDLLLLDEPTNHLDYEAIEWLGDFLNGYQGAVMMVTHDRYFLDRVTNRIFELDHGRLFEYKGNYQAYLEQKAERVREEISSEHKRKQLYKQELAWMRAGAKARSTKQQARINRFEDLKENIDKVKLNGSVDIDIAGQRLGKKVLEIKDGFYRIDDKQLLRDFSLLIQAKDRVGITGLNGAGKSTLLNILAGRIELDSGIYEIGETVRLAYYTQVNEDMNPDKRMITYLQEIAETVKTSDGSTVSVTEMLERFLFPRESHGTLIGKLSGGEKRRLFLLKLLIGQPNVLLLDEPTNDLDIDTLTILEDYINSFNGSVIAVSHDRYFLDKTMEKLLVFEGDGVISMHFGAMSDYIEEQKAIVAPVEEKVTPVTLPASIDDIPKKKKKLSYMEAKEWETIEDDIASLEEKIEQLNEDMVANGSDLGKLNDLQKEIDATQATLDEKYERWEYLSEFAN